MLENVLWRDNVAAYVCKVASAYMKERRKTKTIFIDDAEMMCDIHTNNKQNNEKYRS